MFDPKVVEKISPEYWRNSFLSVAKFYGACIINGTRYVIDPATDWLVREDIFKKELKDAKKLEAVAKAEKKKWEAAAQGDLF